MDRVQTMTEGEYRIWVWEDDGLSTCTVRTIAGNIIACEHGYSPDEAVEFAYQSWFLRPAGI